jgi:hypothetical protein
MHGVVGHVQRRSRGTVTSQAPPKPLPAPETRPTRRGTSKGRRKRASLRAGSLDAGTSHVELASEVAEGDAQSAAFAHVADAVEPEFSAEPRRGAAFSRCTLSRIESLKSGRNERCQGSQIAMRDLLCLCR